jgi:proteasome lid subunit RPN8/RPN11
MTAETFIKNMLKEALEKMFDLDKLRFNEVVIKQDVVENIILLARENHPNEFLAFLDGNIKNERLIVKGLVYQEYYASTESAAPIFHFPDKTFYGSVHSHPGYSNRPSSADRQFFRKIGIVNIIICKPYDIKSMRFYNHEGEEINVKIEE